MDKTLILSLGCEGAGAYIYGFHKNDTWTFWRDSTCMDFDENNEEIWRSYKTEAVPDSLSELPMNWWMFYPTDPPHLDFVEKLCEEYENCRKPMNDENLQSLHIRWNEVLSPSRLLIF